MQGKDGADSKKAAQPVKPLIPDLKPPTGAGAVAWSAFCKRLERAGHLLLSKNGTEEPLYQAETLRFLTRELRAALEWEVDNADPDFPHFVRADESGSGPPGPNLDNSYLWARVRGDTAYRVTIEVDRIFDLIIGITDDQWVNYGDHSLAEFKVNPDGKLDVILSPQKQPGNWIEMPPKGSLIGIRVYFYDWGRDRPPEALIERLGGGPVAPAPLTPNEMARRLDAVSSWLEERPFQYPAWQERWMDQFPANHIPAPVEIPGGGSEIKYGFGRWRLSPDEALIVECVPPKARYWGFHLYTLPWYSQIEVSTRMTALNGKQVRVDSDGKVRIVVAHRDPGVANWLDTAGYPTGAFFYRWIWSEDQPIPVSKVVPFGEIDRHLPADTQRVTPDKRAAEIARRRKHLSLRHRY